MDQILVTGDIRKLFEKPGKVKPGEASQISQPVHVNIFHTVLRDVAAHHHEFLCIFLLLGACNTGKDTVRIKVCPAKGYKEMNHQGIQAGLKQRLSLKIFVLEGDQTSAQAVI